MKNSSFLLRNKSKHKTTKSVIKRKGDTLNVSPLHKVYEQTMVINGIV